MRRVISLYLPTWPTDRLRRKLGNAAPPREAPLVLIGRDARRRVVWAADGAAQALGLRPGRPATQAHALVPDLLTYGAEPADDAAALERLAVWALRSFSPVVAADQPDGLLIDATGAAHLQGGEQGLLDTIVARLGAIGVTGRAAMASTYGAAHALARYRANPTLLVGDGTPGEPTVAAIVDLPIAALRLSPDIIAGLHRLGFDRIGELAAQPRAPLARRLGPEPWRRLDQAYGRLAEPVTLIQPPVLVQVQRNFAEPIGAPETLRRYIAILAGALCLRLERIGEGARSLDLLFYRVDQSVAAIRAGTAKPIREPGRITRLLCDRLETIDPGFGVEQMVLSAPVAEALTYRPVSTLGERPKADVSELIDTLVNRVGAEHLYRIAPIGSDVPERTSGKVAPLAGPTKSRWPLRWPRPARLLARPEPIETMALLPDHPPVHFTWRGRGVGSPVPMAPSVSTANGSRRCEMRRCPCSLRRRSGRGPVFPRRTSRPLT
jgi:protein ImuB